MPLFNKKTGPQRKKKTAASPQDAAAMKRRVATIVTIAGCALMLAGTGTFLWRSLSDIDRLSTEGDGVARIDTVNPALLNDVTRKDAERRSEERRLPDDLRNPFRGPVTPTVPETTTPVETVTLQ